MSHLFELVPIKTSWTSLKVIFMQKYIYVVKVSFGNGNFKWWTLSLLQLKENDERNTVFPFKCLNQKEPTSLAVSKSNNTPTSLKAVTYSATRTSLLLFSLVWEFLLVLDKSSWQGFRMQNGFSVIRWFERFNEVLWRVVGKRRTKRHMKTPSANLWPTADEVSHEVWKYQFQN